MKNKKRNSRLKEIEAIIFKNETLPVKVSFKPEKSKANLRLFFEYRKLFLKQLKLERTYENVFFSVDSSSDNIHIKRKLNVMRIGDRVSILRFRRKHGFFDQKVFFAVDFKWLALIVWLHAENAS